MPNTIAAQPPRRRPVCPAETQRPAEQSRWRSASPLPLRLRPFVAPPIHRLPRGQFFEARRTRLQVPLALGRRARKRNGHIYHIMGSHLMYWVHTVSRFASRDEVVPPAFRQCFTAHTLRAVFPAVRQHPQGLQPDRNQPELCSHPRGGPGLSAAIQVRVSAASKARPLRIISIADMRSPK